MQVKIDTFPDGTPRSHSYIGGYPIFYIDCTDLVFCPDCAVEYEKELHSDHTHMEGAPLHCSDCDKEIDSAYGDPYVECYQCEKTSNKDFCTEIEFNQQTEYYCRDCLPEDSGVISTDPTTNCFCLENNKICEVCCGV